MKSATKKLVLSSLLAALTCVATMLIRIPSPLHGYINLGDCIVLICGWIPGPVYGAIAAGIGAALADVLGGYLQYAPATFVIKALMAVLAWVLWRSLSKTKLNRLSYIFSAAVSELLMVAGYFVFESFMYGFGAVIVNVLPNVVQGVAGAIVGCLLIAFLNKSKLTQKL